VVEQIHDCLNDFHAHSGHAPAQTRRKDQQHRAHGIVRQRFTNSRGVRANEIALHLANLIGWNANAGKRAKTSVHAIHCFRMSARLLIDDGSRGVDCLPGPITKLNAPLMPSYGFDFG
jgi:hypothetical protein